MLLTQLLECLVPIVILKCDNLSKYQLMLDPLMCFIKTTIESDRRTRFCNDRSLILILTSSTIMSLRVPILTNSPSTPKIDTLLVADRDGVRVKDQEARIIRHSLISLANATEVAGHKRRLWS
jgi:hypothetical protein